MQKTADTGIEGQPQAPTRLYPLLLSTLWIAVRLLAGYVMAKQVSPFFYQQF